MKTPILAILATLALAACSSTGVGFVAPSDMTPADACYNAQVVLALMDVNNVETLAPDTYERAAANVQFLCALVPEAAQ